MDNYFMNKYIFETTVTMILCILIVFFIFITIKSDKARCEKNGGVYIWEFSRSSKCHLKGGK